MNEEPIQQAEQKIEIGRIIMGSTLQDDMFTPNVIANPRATTT